MANKGDSRFNVTIQPFEGDAELLPFFCKQVRDLAKVNRWSGAQTSIFIRSKLVGPALKYVIGTSELLETEDYEFLLQGLKSFFAPSSSINPAFLNPQTITLLPAESIRNLAHRISVQVSKVYPTVNDPEALNNLKLVALFNALPQDIKVQLLRDNIKDFQTAVVRADTLQQLESSNNLVSSVNSSLQVQELHAEINALKEQVILLSQPNSQVNAIQASSTLAANTQTQARRPLPSERFQRRAQRDNNSSHASFSRSGSRHNISRVVCQFCNKTGHVLAKCFKFQREFRSDQSSHTRNYRQSNNSFRHNSYRGRNSNLNPNASSFAQDSLN